MGIWRNVFGLGPLVHADVAAPAESASTFAAVDADSIDPAVFGLTSYAAPTAPAPRIDRRTAIQVPAVKRSRDLVCATLGGLPLDVIGTGSNPITSPLLTQPEKNVPRSVTMTRLFEDLFFEEVAWWRVVELQGNFPSRVKRLKPSSVSVDDKAGKVYVDGKEVDSSELIRFDSPTDGLLTAGARAIRTCLGLETAAAQAADGAPPIDYFTPADDADPLDDDDEIVGILNDWNEARRQRRTAYVPAALKYNVAGWDPEKLQLAEARKHAVLEIARIAGVDPEDLGVSTTSRTYANQFDRRKAFLDFTLGQYRQSVEDRLSMGDVTPRGQVVKFNLDAFLRSDTKTRFETYEIGLRIGALTQPEVRELEDRPPLEAPAAQPAPLRSLPAPQENVS